MKDILSIITGAGRLVSLCTALLSGLFLHAAEYTDAEREALWQQPDFVEAYLAIADPGDILYSVYGHACLHLVCEAYGLDRYFTEESEDVNTKILRFFCGNLTMGVKSFLPEDYLALYRKESRGVAEYRLNLPIGVKRNLWKILDEHLTEERIPYDYYRHGCALSCVQWINEALTATYGNAVQIRYAPWTDYYNRTPREIGGAAASIAPWTQYIIYFIVGNEMDRPVRKEHKLILPSDLAAVWQRATVEGVPLLSPEPHETVPSSHIVKASPVTPLMAAWLLVALAVLAFFLPARRAKGINTIIIGLQTLSGCFLTYLTFFSDLCCTDWNWLLIAFNPLPLLLLIPARSTSLRRAKGWFAVFLATMNIVWCIVMLIIPRTIVIAPHIIQTTACSICLLQSSLPANKLHFVRR